MTGRTRRAVEDRRAEILDATVKIIERDGLANTRVGDVARELNISSALIHYHFGTKEGLIADAFAHAFGRDLDDLQRALESDDVLVTLRRLSRLFNLPGAPVGWQVWIDACAMAQREPAILARIQGIDHRYSAALQGVIERGIAAGVLTCPDPPASVARIFALNDGLSTAVAVIGSVTRAQLRVWVAHQIAIEVGLPPDALN